MGKHRNRLSLDPFCTQSIRKGPIDFFFCFPYRLLFYTAWNGVRLWHHRLRDMSRGVSDNIPSKSILRYRLTGVNMVRGPDISALFIASSAAQASSNARGQRAPCEAKRNYSSDLTLHAWTYLRFGAGCYTGGCVGGQSVICVGTSRAKTRNPISLFQKTAGEYISQIQYGGDARLLA